MQTTARETADKYLSFRHVRRSGSQKKFAMRAEGRSAHRTTVMVLFQPSRALLMGAFYKAEFWLNLNLNLNVRQALKLS